METNRNALAPLIRRLTIERFRGIKHLAWYPNPGVNVILGGDDRNDRDLRLIQGSALDRLISDKTLRSRLGQKLGEGDVEEQLKDDAKRNLKSLEVAFEEQAIPVIPELP